MIKIGRQGNREIQCYTHRLIEPDQARDIWHQHNKLGRRQTCDNAQTFGYFADKISKIDIHTADRGEHQAVGGGHGHDVFFEKAEIFLLARHGAVFFEVDQACDSLKIIFYPVMQFAQ